MGNGPAAHADTRAGVEREVTAAVRRDIHAFIAESEAGRDVEALVEELLS